MCSSSSDIANAIAQYICSSNEAVRFKLVRGAKDIESDDGFFQPDMSHQIFGEREQIFGYKNLKINLLYAASTLHLYVSIKFAKKINPKFAEGVEADSIWEPLKNILPKKFFENVDDFSLRLEEQSSFSPYGKLLTSYTRNNLTKTFNIYKADLTCPGFRSYHQRMESFILWFIDAASYIDVDDEKWDFYVLYEKCIKNGKSTYNFVGYCTCYRFYAYPDKYRPRISQILILPPYQKNGHCSELLKAIYRQYISDPRAVDITAEDPSDNFQRVRDFVDARNCSTLESFAPKKLQMPFSKEMASEAEKNFKINKKQCQRIYEILRLKYTNKNDSKQLTAYRLAVKERLNKPFKDIIRKQSKLSEKVLMPSLDEKHLLLQKEYQLLYEEYQRVIARLENS